MPVKQPSIQVQAATLHLSLIQIRSTALKSTETESSRRSFWTSQMDSAMQFMQLMRDAPVTDNGEPLVSLIDAAEKSGAEVRFSKTRIAGSNRLFYLRQGLIKNFLNLAHAMNKIG